MRLNKKFRLEVVHAFLFKARKLTERTCSNCMCGRMYEHFNVDRGTNFLSFAFFFSFISGVCFLDHCKKSLEKGFGGFLADIWQLVLITSKLIPSGYCDDKLV